MNIEYSWKGSSYSFLLLKNVSKFFGFANKTKTNKTSVPIELKFNFFQNVSKGRTFSQECLNNYSIKLFGVLR